jgi:hypothetical protein
MKFLADESCDFAVVRTLRDAGYEVLAVSEVSPSASVGWNGDHDHLFDQLA